MPVAAALMTEGSSDPLPENFSYDPKTFAREEQPHELPASFAPLYHSFAFESNKRSNLHYLDEVPCPVPPEPVANPLVLLPRLPCHGALAPCQS